MSVAHNSIHSTNRQYSDDTSPRDRCDGTIAIRSSSPIKEQRKLTSGFHIAIVQANGYEFHAANLLLRLLRQQAMLHGLFQAIAKRLKSFSFRFHPRKLSGTCVGLLFIPSRSFLTLGQCAIRIPDGVFRCAKLAPESCDQDAKLFLCSAHTLIPRGIYERNTCTSNLATFSLPDSH